MRNVFLCGLLLAASVLSGCAVVSATGTVIGAAGTVVSATANATAGAINAVAGGGHHHDKHPEKVEKVDCTDASKDPACQAPAQ